MKGIGRCQHPDGCKKAAVIWNDRREVACGAHQNWLARRPFRVTMAERMGRVPVTPEAVRKSFERDSRDPDYVAKIQRRVDAALGQLRDMGNVA